MTTFGLSARAHTLRIRIHTRTGTHTHGVLSSLPPHAGVFTIYSAPRVGNAVGYLVDIVYLGYNPPHDPRDFSSTTAAYRVYIYIYIRRRAAREEASTKRLLLAPGLPLPETNGPVAHIGIRSARRLNTYTYAATCQSSGLYEIR